MKKGWLAVLVVASLGCAQNLETVMDDPASLLADPHFAQYQSKANELESDYLKKDISYADYLQRKKQLDEDYAKEVQERTQVIENANPEQGF